MKRLASGASHVWETAPLPACFAGETRIETRNSVYLLRDGICHAVTRREFVSTTGTHKTDLVGMRLMGWVGEDDMTSLMQLEWDRGVRGVLWRARRPGERHSVVALTSPTLAFLRS
jgi:hypothetical protein